MTKIRKSGIALYLALIGFSLSKIIGLFLGAIIGALVAATIAETNSPSIIEYFVWCGGFALLGIFVGSIANMPHKNPDKSKSDVGSADPKMSAPDDFGGGGGCD
ncbi:hypothetical protein ACYTPF_19250 [Alteromonas sp. HB246098]